MGQFNKKDLNRIKAVVHKVEGSSTEPDQRAYRPQSQTQCFVRLTASLAYNASRVTTNNAVQMWDDNGTMRDLGPIRVQPYFPKGTMESGDTGIALFIDGEWRMAIPKDCPEEDDD